MSYIESKTLAKEQEELALYREMQTDVVQQVMRRLAAVKVLMQLRSDQLERHLQQGLRPLYTVHGDEPLLSQEAADAIRARGARRRLHRTPGVHRRPARTSTGARCSARRRR